MPSLRERKKLKTRADLERAALRLFEERGFENVSVEEVAQAADVSRRTFFRYFVSKEDVFFSDNGRVLTRITELLGRQPPSPAYPALCNALLGLAEELEPMRTLVARRNAVIEATPRLVARRLEIEMEWAGELAGTLAQRAGSGGPQGARLLAQVCLAALAAATTEWSDGQRDRPLRDCFLAIMDELRASLDCGPL